MTNPSPQLDRDPSASRLPPDRLLDDCWFVEVMPPTWAWAYRRLLDSGERSGPRFTNRMA